MADTIKKVTDDPYGAMRLIRRLIAEQGVLYWRRYLLAFVCMGIAATATALSAYILGDVINEAYVKKNLQGIVLLAGSIFGLFFIKGLATYLQSIILSRISNAIIARNQRMLFAKLMHENLAFFSERHSSEFIARLSQGASAITQVLNLLITAIGRDVLSLVGLVTVMVIQDPYMAIFGFLIAPPAMLLLRKMIRRIKTIAHNQFTGGTRIIETLQESLQGIRTVKAFTLEPLMQDRIDRHIAELEQNANKLARVANRSGPLMETLGGMAVAAALIYGGYRVVGTSATPGQFFSFMTAFLLAYEPAKKLARLNLDLNTALIGAQKLLEIVDQPASEPSDDDKPALRLNEARIELREVDFAYRADEPVLRKMSFVAEPGRVTALVGPSGGGKSTVFNLLLRLSEPNAGTILMDAQNIADISRRSLRAQIGYVGQDVFLFRGTIRDNIRFGRPDASMSEIEAAARAAQAHEFITSFPNGYDTQVGELGTQISGGQRQRIAIARALIKDAPIILLDEATAALDSESERAVQLAIQHLCQGRTTLVIAHRLHTIMHSDCIHVIEGGEVIETGPHDELIARNGRYADFFRLQQHSSATAAP